MPNFRYLRKAALKSQEREHDRPNCTQYSPSLRNNFDSLARDQRQPGSFYVSEMSLGTTLGPDVGCSLMIESKLLEPGDRLRGTNHSRSQSPTFFLAGGAFA